MSADTPSRGARILSWLVVVLAALFVVLGAAWYGISLQVEHRVWHDLVERPDGPLAFRAANLFVLAPIFCRLDVSVAP